jgi:hypothetical protein
MAGHRSQRANVRRRDARPVSVLLCSCESPALLFHVVPRVHSTSSADSSLGEPKLTFCKPCRSSAVSGASHKLPSLHRQAAIATANGSSIRFRRWPLSVRGPSLPLSRDLPKSRCGWHSARSIASSSRSSAPTSATRKRPIGPRDREPESSPRDGVLSTANPAARTAAGYESADAEVGSVGGSEIATGS